MLAVVLLTFLAGLPAPDFASRDISAFWGHRRSKVLHVVPQVPNLRPRFERLPKMPIVNVLIQGTWRLDGLNCVGCRLRNAVLRYSGGSFRCSQCWVEESLTIILYGAAMNTSAVNTWLDRLRDGSDPAVLPRKTVTKTVHLKQPLKVDLVSPPVPP